MRQRRRGFTLIEMLVVLLIIGVLLGITLLSPITGSLHKVVQEQAARLEVLFAQIRDKSLLENVEYGFSVGKDGTYQWWLLPLESKEWIQLTDSPFQPYKIPDNLDMMMSYKALRLCFFLIVRLHPSSYILFLQKIENNQ